VLDTLVLVIVRLIGRWNAGRQVVAWKKFDQRIKVFIKTEWILVSYAFRRRSNVPEVLTYPPPFEGLP
jgi:hypothetical protein